MCFRQYQSHYAKFNEANFSGFHFVSYSLADTHTTKNFRVSTDKMNNSQARFGDFALVDLITGDTDVEILIPHVNKTVNNTITDTLTVELIDIR